MCIRDRKKTVKFNLDFDLPKSCKLGAYVNIFRYDKDGFECAQSQHKLEVEVEKITAPKKLAKLNEEKLSITANGNGFEYSFSKQYGNFESIKINGEEKILDVIKLGVWHAPTDHESKNTHYWGG